MTSTALGLVLVAAFSHATWNLVAKRVGGGPAFVWLFGVVAVGVYAPLAGAIIAGYTLWDKRAVSALGIPPLLYDWCGNLGRVLILTPVALGRSDEIRGLWRDHRREVLVMAVLTPLSYILVLTALVFTPVSYVAPAREISILVGTVMGARLLAEGDSARRLVAAGAMVVGVAALVIG